MLLIAMMLAAVQDVPKPGKPVGDMTQWVRPSDQPRYNLGAARIKVMFKPDGKVDHCDIAATTGDREIERAACGAARKRFQYEPSLSSAGQPVHRILETPVNLGAKTQEMNLIVTPAMYALGAQSADTAALRLLVEVDEAGGLVSCAGSDPAVAAPACQKLAGMWKPLPESDSGKKPVRYIREILVTL